MIESFFFDILRYSLEPDSNIPDHISDIDWFKLYRFAEEQGILGVVFVGILRLGEHGVKPPFDVLMQWISASTLIERQNKVANKAAFSLSEELNKNGFRGCILKGQGNNLMYPNVYSRTPGDIDVWLLPKSDIRGIIKYVKERNPKAKARYHHIDYGIYEGVDVEVHYRPSFMCNPVHNRRLQRWFRKMADGGCQMVDLPEDAGSIRIPNKEFNIIFQLSHIYKHFLHEGIGLRQFVDYYYVLKNDKELDEVKGSNRSAQKVNGQYRDLQRTLQYLGLWKIAGAVMWVLHEALGVEEKCLIAPMDEKRGKLLMNEILRGGNFGHYDSAYRKANTPFKKNILRLIRDARMIRYYPSECIWEPAFRLYHYFWRQWQKYG